jgi:hypothetical protein
MKVYAGDIPYCVKKQFLLDVVPFHGWQVSPAARNSFASFPIASAKSKITDAYLCYKKTTSHFASCRFNI